MRLVKAETGEVLATLRPVEAPVIADLCFGPGGAHLAAAADDGAAHLWDLRLIRQELARLGLDWELPAYPPAARRPAAPLAVEVVN